MGGNQRSDLVVEDAEGKLWRIQCKTGRINSNKSSLQFSTANQNVTGVNRKARHYRGQCDYFAVYNAELNKVYLISVDEVGITNASFRLTPLNKKKQHRMAVDYEL